MKILILVFILIILTGCEPSFTFRQIIESQTSYTEINCESGFHINITGDSPYNGTHNFSDDKCVASTTQNIQSTIEIIPKDK